MAESDLIRGNVDTVILKVLYEGDRYGYDLIKQINARSDGQWEIKQPTVYACLKRLEKQGFISSYWDSSESEGGRRKYYSLTDSGRDVFLKYKSEFERATALFGGILSDAEPAVFIQPEDDYSDVEEEGYSLPKRRAKRPAQKKQQPEPEPEPETQQPIESEQQPVAEPEQQPVAELEQQPVVEPEQKPAPEQTEVPQDIFMLLQQQAEQQSAPVTPQPQPQPQPEQTVEALDPQKIIEQLFAAENGESYSDLQRKSTYTTGPIAEPVSKQPIERQQPAPTPPPVTPAAQSAPTPPQPTPAPAPAAVPAPRQEAAAVPKAQPAPPVTVPAPTVPAPVGFAADEESPARREYKTVLEELVDRFEVTPPDVRSASVPAAEQAATEERAERSEFRQLTKVEQAVRELGNDVKVRSHNNSAKEYSGKNFYYSNKLMMTQYTGVCAAMFLVGLVLFLTFYTWLNMRMRYDYLLYIGAGLLPIIMFIASVIRFASNPDKTKRNNFNFKFFIIIRFVIMIQVAVVIYCVNLIWGMPLGFAEYYIPSLVLPLAYALFIPISEIAFMSLLKSGRYAVND